MMDCVSLSRLRARSEKPTDLLFHIHLHSCYLIRIITVDLIKEMVRSIWCLREKGSKIPDYDVEYGGTDTISLSVHELNYMVIELGYQKEQYLYYHYCIPDQPLDFGLIPLGNDADVLKLISYVPKFRQINLPEMDVRSPSQKEIGSCSKAMVPHTKYQGASVTQEFEQVEDFGFVQADGGYDIEFEEQPPQFHFEIPNIDDAFHYDDYSLYAAFDAEYNSSDVLEGVGVEDSSVESGWRTASEGNKDEDSDGDSSVGDSCLGTVPKGRRPGKRKVV
ncbi:hypothetical protein LXL04_004822 [Taraxacum kok-saghyz]